VWYQMILASAAPDVSWHGECQVAKDMPAPGTLYLIGKGKRHKAKKRGFTDSNRYFRDLISQTDLKKNSSRLLFDLRSLYSQSVAFSALYKVLIGRCRLL
jgi:hypothetical protein